MEKTNYQKMIAGEPYNGIDLELFELADSARHLMAKLNEVPIDDKEGRAKALRDLLGDTDEHAFVVTPFFADYGIHVNLGACFVNVGATFLDSAHITIGDRTMVGPNVQFITASHPVLPEERMRPDPDAPIVPIRVSNIAKPITIGDDCWIGAGAIILPGVTIGNGTTVGAGAVVTKSLPERVVALGNPARVTRSVDD